jgi:hypothetical protein
MSSRLLLTGKTLSSRSQAKHLSLPIKRLGYLCESTVQEDLLALLEYDVTYFFKGTRGKTRRTLKGIEWKAQKPEGQPGPKGGKVVKVVTVRYYQQNEE